MLRPAGSGGCMLGFLFSAAGRVSRKGMWLFLLTALAVQAAAVAADVALSRQATAYAAGPAAMIAALALAWPSLAVTIKRFHDRGMSGWWAALPFAVLAAGVGAVLLIGAGEAFAIFNAAAQGANVLGIGGVTMGVGAAFMAAMGGVALFQFAVLYCLPGVRGPNAYGGDPRREAAAFNPVNLDRIRAKPKQADPHAPPPTARRLEPAFAQAPDWGFGRVHERNRGQARVA